MKEGSSNFELVEKAKNLNLIEVYLWEINWILLLYETNVGYLT